MEAASARYAARDRFGFPSEPASTPLQRYIQNACSPENFEPNLALSLEIADLINQKKGSAPREAAVAVVGYINHRNPNVSLLALSLLDICVKNCGYPFHLQISTKEFLNELVRRFPERPPVRTTRVQNRILELVEEWRRTICETSKYKEDLGFIRDMHRLLSYKGYMFPEVRREDAAVLNPSDNLKSAEEMEEEERTAQSAKLQELIRRGTPHDLQEANRLMKIMAGYDTRHKTDYRAKAAGEVSKIQQKARLLEEMLQGYREGDAIQEDGVFEELANALASAHPKIQKMCEEESDDHEAVAKLFEINDSIHRTIERYRLIKKGDIAAANAIPKGTLGVSGPGVKQGPDNELSLIDFGGTDEPATTSPSGASEPPRPKASALEDDLLGLNMGDGNYGAGGELSLGGPPPAPANGTTKTADIMAMFSSPSTKPAQSPRTPQPASSLPPALQQPQYQHPKPPQATSKSDPFASLATPPREASPFNSQRSASRSPAPPQSTSGIDLLGLDSSTNAAPPPPDDEWTFTSALPDATATPAELTVTNSSIHARFAVSLVSPDELLIHNRISNTTTHPIADLNFKLAVAKVRRPPPPPPRPLTDPPPAVPHPPHPPPIRLPPRPAPARRHPPNHPSARRRPTPHRSLRLRLRLRARASRRRPPALARRVRRAGRRARAGAGRDPRAARVGIVIDRRPSGEDPSRSGRSSGVGSGRA